MAEERRIPQPTELVFEPQPSWAPMFTALGFALILVGLFVWFPYGVIGAMIFLIAVVSWIRKTRGEVDRLPRVQHPSAAVLPARPLNEREDGSP